MTGFTDQEKVKIRHHLGYLNVAASATFVLGSPAAIETQFIIESAMNLVLVAAEPEVRRQLTILDCIEEQMNSDRELLAVNEVGEIKIRGTEMKELRVEYQFWRRALGNLLGCYPNPFDKRFDGPGINVTVNH
jgi:capsule polysaccharide export protein KpsE/RkpR